MQAIEKRTDLIPVSFIPPKTKLSKSQLILLELLTHKIAEKEPIEEKDIIEAYFKAVSTDGKTIRIRRCLAYSQYFECWHVDKTDWRVRPKALAWFNINLGACIVKGKLLVIPVIDIE